MRNETQNENRDRGFRPTITVEPGDIVTFFVAAKVVQELPRGFVEVLDEDGFKHEVPNHILRPAREPAIERFERKIDGRVNSDAPPGLSRLRPPAEVETPPPFERVEPVPQKSLRDRRTDRRRDFQERRKAKRRGDF